MKIIKKLRLNWRKIHVLFFYSVKHLLAIIIKQGGHQYKYSHYILTFKKLK